MSLRSTVWLLETTKPKLPERQFLHVFEDETTEWSPDRTKALRFASAIDASGFAWSYRIAGAITSEHLAADVVDVAELTDLEAAFA